ncbi:MAG: hypothetical protein N3F06_02275, partial [Nitrososphaerales archaeon]|nr:hypothetical protein [Nitrososphaerales archaeon]
LSKSKALDLCAVGPVARGSGVRADVRLDDPYAAYGEVPFDMVVYEEGDVWSRLMIRCDEIIEIIKIINYCLDHLPPKPYRARVPALLTPPAGRESMSRVEAPRGELIHHVFSDGSEKPYRVKVRTPTLANIPAVIEMLKGGHIADIPASLASIDPCFCCTDRVTIVDIKKGSKESLTLEDIRRKYNSRR